MPESPESRAGASPLLRPGESCWRVERAGRAAFLIDAAGYYEALERALRRARRSVLILGWDVHSRVRLGVRAEPGDGVELGALLRELTDERPELRVHVLAWDWSPIYAAERELLTRVQLGWLTGEQVSLHMDSAHPVGGSQHQKIVVIDDALAFVGGIDLTIARWDESTHAPDDPRRELPDGEPYGPFHDAQMAVDGDAAAAVGELARERWRMATGEELEPATVESDPWPPELTPDLREVRVGIARTLPRYGERTDEVREIEQLHLAAIAAARRWLYIENQYLTSASVREALAARLREEAPPEIVLVTTRDHSGPLEDATIGALRTGFVRALRRLDPGGKLAVVAPVSGGDTGVYVHAKIAIVDDRFVRIGSANLSNRSMGLDVECDLAVEAEDEDEDDEISATFAALRTRLMAEHLGVAPEEVRAVVEREGSLVAALRELGGGPRTLIELELEPQPTSVDPALFDPSEPVPEALARRGLPEGSLAAARRRLPARATTAGLALLAMAGVGLWAHLGSPGVEAVDAYLEEARSVPLLALGAFVLAALLFVPLNVLIVVAAATLGFGQGLVVALVGAVLAGLAGYALGRAFGARLGRLAGGGEEALRERLGRRGLLAVVAVHVVPVAPFLAVCLAAGRSRVSLRDFALGTLLGTLPGAVLLALATDRMVTAVREPGALAIGLAVGALALLALASYALHRVLVRSDGG